MFYFAGKGISLFDLTRFAFSSSHTGEKNI